MRSSIVLTSMVALSGASACQSHVCEDDPARCDLHAVIEPSRLALNAGQMTDFPRLSIRFTSADALAANFELSVTQSKGAGFSALLKQSEKDPHQYTIDLSQHMMDLVPGSLSVLLPASPLLPEPTSLASTLFDQDPFSKVKQISFMTSQIDKYQLTAPYSLTVAKSVGGMDPAVSYLLVFGASGLTPNSQTQSLKYDLRIDGTPSLVTSTSMIASYAYSVQSDLWLGSIVYDATSQLAFYYATVATAAQGYRLIRCSERGNLASDCISAGGQTNVSAALRSAGSEVFRSMAVDASGKLVVLTNDTVQEAYAFTGSAFSNVTLPGGGRRLRHLAVATAGTAPADLPDIFAISDDYKLLLYRYASGSFGPPIALYDLKEVFPATDVSALAVGDVNGDDLPDVVVASNNVITYLVNTGQNSTGGPTLVKAPHVLNGKSQLRIRTLVVTDIDGDKCMDIIAGSDAGVDASTSSSAVEFFLSNRK